MNRMLGAIALVLFITSVVVAQDPPRRGHGAPGPHCAATIEEMKAGDARLDEKLAAMNAATGAEKVDAIAAVVNELAAQRKALREKMAGMPGGACPMMQ